MTISGPVNCSRRSLSQDGLSAARHYLGSRAGLVAIAAAALGLGAYFNWGWLVAAGVAPLLTGVAPCAAMCALGLCMSGRSRATPAPDQASTTMEPTKLTTEASDKHGKGCC